MPQTIDEKVRLFQKAIMEKASAERDQILRETEAFTKREMDRAKDRQLETMYRDIQAQISEMDLEASRAVAREARTLKQGLYLWREQYLAELLVEVRARLVKFTQSSAYEPFLLEKLRALAQAYPPAATAVLEARSQDVPFIKANNGLYGGCEVRANDGEIQIGGLRMADEARGIAADETLDNALEQQRVWFHDTSHFYFE